MSPGESGPGRDLVEQRLEQVVVAPVDEGDVDPVVLAQLLRRVQAAEAAADDQDAVSGRRRRGHLARSLDR